MINIMLIAMVICFLLSIIFLKIGNGKGVTGDIFWFFLSLIGGIVLFIFSFILLIIEHFK